jgi:hypothetical protein
MRRIGNRTHRFPAAKHPLRRIRRVSQRSFVELLGFHPGTTTITVGEIVRLVFRMPIYQARELRMNL